MSFLDRIFYTLNDEHAGTPYQQNIYQDIKNNINVLLNAKLDDYLSLMDEDLSSLADLNLTSKNLANIMSSRIYEIISKNERRARILSIEFDDSLAPWQLMFILRLHYNSQPNREFSVNIIFRNNRYCEIG